MGIATVAVYSDVDAQSLHVKMADQAVPIGGATSRDSYLRIDAILSAVAATSAQAVHPGFGFLSESADFATALQAAGVIFYWPRCEVRSPRWATKFNREKLADKAGVNIIPGYPDALVDARRGCTDSRTDRFPGDD